ncbi:MAG: hypothetical protein KDA21_12610 [Phycisphaerales bacterium]|nr:hypothetical protein [Phycisphaerales bacterium]
MPFRVGVLAYPLFLMVIGASRADAVGPYERAEAYTPERSRRPESLNVPYKAIRRALKRGLLVAAGPGRYYLDRKAVARRDRNRLLLWGSVILSTIAMVVLLW